MVSFLYKSLNHSAIEFLIHLIMIKMVQRARIPVITIRRKRQSSWELEVTLFYSVRLWESISKNKKKYLWYTCVYEYAWVYT